ncbi:hypothetical protein, partial [Halalkalibacter alkalisediminis]|uniref:hypothetical protein n=1 Tax=Halalkalibacter alkalisediminis TaxID=935616 RepID=UPI0023608CC0
KKMSWLENFIRSVLGRSVAVRLTNRLILKLITICEVHQYGKRECYDEIFKKETVNLNYS